MDINIKFCQTLYSNVVAQVRKINPTIQVSSADIYISNDRSNAGRWFTFDYEGFHFEDYVDNVYDGRAQAWMKWVEKQRALKHKEIYDMIMGEQSIDDKKIEKIITLFWGE